MFHVGGVTVGRTVKRLRSYIKERDQFLDLGVDGTINQYLMVRIKNSISNYLLLSINYWLRIGTGVELL